MNKPISLTFCLLFMAGLLTARTLPVSDPVTDTLKKNGYTLLFRSNDPDLDPVVRQKLIDTYFKVYQVLVHTFNKRAAKDVVFLVDTAYKAVAECGGNQVKFSAAYLKARPYDTDVVTHETMHIVQGYGNSSGPVWLTEGIADYVRYVYGIDNTGSKWTLPAFNPKQHYTNSYRITARFFVWIEQHVRKGTVKKMDERLRNHTFSEDSWKEITGKDLEALWSEYAKDPQIKA